MLASVHVADVGSRRCLSASPARVTSASVPGLRWARPYIAQPLRRGMLPSPGFGRLALLAFWDGADALDAFEADHPFATNFTDGWRVRMTPQRAFGTWPGLDPDLPHRRRLDQSGPAVVLTLGRLRTSQTVRFLRTSAKAEAAALDAPGFIWGTGLARPPFVATCSLWSGEDAIAAYAFDGAGAHPGVITADRARPFHHQQAFVRFRPVAESGALDGTNPLAAASVLPTG
jgi:hypothetical protein